MHSLCDESTAGMEGCGGGAFALAMGQTQYRLAAHIKAVLRTRDVCRWPLANLIYIKPRKGGEATPVGLWFRRDIVMVTGRTSSDKGPRVQLKKH